MPKLFLSHFTWWITTRTSLIDLIELSTSVGMLLVLAPPHCSPGHQLHHPQRPRGARRQHHQLYRHQWFKAAGKRSVFKGETLPDKKLWGVPGLAHYGQPGTDGGERACMLGGPHLPLPPSGALAAPLSHLCPLCILPPCLHDGAASGDMKEEVYHCLLIAS